MANRNQLSYGSQGSDVTELQKLLNQKGYNLSTDGIFGDKTQQAVKDYQQKNNLTVDGIVGTNTWSSLGTLASTGAAAAGTSATPAATSDTSFKFDAYQESDAVRQAKEMLQQQMNNKPGAYQSAWQDQLNEIMGKILNREDFTYDLNGDALYQQYKDQYTTQGKMAMMDTMGQAAAMTGGYGNSYAQSVGQQAYQGHLQQLNDKVPELYQLALDKYNQEGQDLYNQYSLIGSQEEQDYGRYRDTVSDWQSEADRLQNQYNAERDYDYGKYSDDRNFAYGQFSDDRAYDYQIERDKVADEQWQQEFDEAVRQFNETHKKNKTSSSSGGGGGNSSSNTNPDTDGETEQKDLSPYAQLQKDLNDIISGSDASGKKVSKSEVSKVIREAVNNGEITQNQAQGLLKTYAPRGYTY